MSGRQRSLALGSGILILIVGTLVLAACNSSSVSGTPSKASSSTTAETKAPSNATNSQPKGLIDAALSKTR